VLCIKKHKPDVVFLDIEMPVYAGYELVRFFDVIDFQIVFVTAYDQYAIKAFEVNAIDYLLKPIDRERLTLTIKKIEQKINNDDNTKQYQALLDELSLENSPTIILSEAGQKQRIKTKEIIAIYAQGAYSEVHLTNNTKITVTKNIGSLADEIGEDISFFRSHKSWLINLSHIEFYAKGAQDIKLKGNLTCKLSRFKKAEFETIFNSL